MLLVGSIKAIVEGIIDLKNRKKSQDKIVTDMRITLSENIAFGSYVYTWCRSCKDFQST